MSDVRQCPVQGCSNTHDYRKLMCGRCWRSLPKPLRDELWRAYDSEEGIFGDAYMQAREACIAYTADREVSS